MLGGLVVYFLFIFYFLFFGIRGGMKKICLKRKELDVESVRLSVHVFKREEDYRSFPFFLLPFIHFFILGVPPGGFPEPP